VQERLLESPQAVDIQVHVGLPKAMEPPHRRRQAVDEGL
jgi:hypothetical protein